MPAEPARAAGDAAPAIVELDQEAEDRPEGGRTQIRRAGLPARTGPPPATDRPPIETARHIVELAEDKKAADIVLLEIGHLTTVADYLVICSGGSERQLGAIADGITAGLKATDTSILSREGEPISHWILLDVGSVIVHVFAPPERDFYMLEKLWPEARTILRLQ